MEGVDAPPVLRYIHQSPWVLRGVNLHSGMGTSGSSGRLFQPSMGPMDREPTFWNGHQWVRRRVAPATDSNIYSTVSRTLHIKNSLTTCDRLHVPSFPATLLRRNCGGNAVLADPQGRTQLPAVGFRLSEAFNNALDMETTSPWPGPRRVEEIQSGVVPRPGRTTSQELNKN
jgi:hypothetical protein